MVVKSYKYQKRRLGGRRYQQKRKSILKKRVFWRVFLGLIFTLSFGYLLFFSTAFKIKKIEIISPPEISARDLERLLQEELQKNYFYLLKKDKFFLLKSSTIENKILKKFPKIKKANLKKKFPASLFLEVKKRNGAAVWCYPEKCFLVDDEQVIFDPIENKEDFKGKLPLVFSQDAEKQILEEACSEKEMEQILKIHSTLKERLNIDIENFNKEKGGPLTVKTTEGWEIYFDLKSDIDLALTKLRLLLEKEINPEKRKNLQYIELRFTKAYYK